MNDSGLYAECHEGLTVASNVQDDERRQERLRRRSERSSRRNEREDKMKQMMKEKQGEEICMTAAREVMSLHVTMLN